MILRMTIPTNLRERLPTMAASIYKEDKRLWLSFRLLLKYFRLS